MQKLNLETKTKEQELVKAYLQENASDVLAEKINNGVIIEKDGKRLINRKTLDGFMKYACDEARKQAEKGKNSACIQDSVVYGWAIHYFEEDSLEGVLYNEDGTEHKPAPIVKQSAPVTPVPTPKPASKPQMSLFDLMTEQEKPAEPVQEKPKDELKPARQALSPIPDANSDEEDNGISDEELQEVFAELAEEERQQTQQEKPAGSPVYRKYMEVQNKYPDSIVIYRLGDFYEVFGENAVKIAEELDLTLTGRDCGLDERVPMIGFPCHTADNCFQKLVEKGYTLAVCETLGDMRRMSKPKQNILDIDEETGEILSEEEMRLFDGDMEEPDELFDNERQSAKAFDMDALCKLDEIFGNTLNVR